MHVSHCDWSLHQDTKLDVYYHIYAVYLTVHHLIFLVYIVELTRNSKYWNNEWGRWFNDGMEEKISRKEHVQYWIKVICFCFTPQSKMFQPYLWQPIDLRRDWRRSLTYGQDSMPKAFRKVLLGQSKHRHGSTLFLFFFSGKPDPLSCNRIHQMIDLILIEEIHVNYMELNTALARSRFPTSKPV